MGRPSRVKLDLAVLVFIYFRTLGAFYEDYPLIATFPLQTGQSRAHRPDKALADLWESSGHAGGNTLSGCKNERLTNQ